MSAAQKIVESKLVSLPKLASITFERRFYAH